MLADKRIACQWMAEIAFKRFVTDSVTVSPSRHRSAGPGTSRSPQLQADAVPLSSPANNQWSNRSEFR
jgi:hypothetical protein